MKNSKDKKVFERVIVDREQGEVIKHEVVKRIGDEPAFIKLYLDCVCAFKGISGTLNPILLELLKHMSYANTEELEGGQIIYLNAALKRSISEKTGKTVKRIEQALTNFVKTGILRRIDTGTYQVNAELFGKGDWKDIKNIRATIDFKDNYLKADIIKS